MDPDTTERHTDSIRYLRHLARLYPSIESVSGEIIHLRAQLDLPKGTEHFISDIHGEYEAFRSVLSHASGSIRRKIDELFGGRVLSEEECSALGALIYAPERNLPRMLGTAEDETRWYRDTLHRMIEVLRVVSSKYHRPKVRRRLLEPFSDIVEELLYEQEQPRDKADYFCCSPPITGWNRAPAARCGLWASTTPPRSSRPIRPGSAFGTPTKAEPFFGASTN